MIRADVYWAEIISYYWPKLLLIMILLAALVWVIVRFWHFKPSFLLAFSGVWLAGGLTFFWVAHSEWWPFIPDEETSSFFRIFLANSSSVAFIFVFAVLIALLALVRASFDDRPVRKRKPADPPVLAEKEGTDEKN